MAIGPKVHNPRSSDAVSISPQRADPREANSAVQCRGREPFRILEDRRKCDVRLYLPELAGRSMNLRSGTGEWIVIRARPRRKDTRRRSDGSCVCESELAEECEAFMAGHYAQYLDHDGQSVPDWAWPNVLAHGSEDDIRDLATVGPRPGDAGCRRAWAFLAQEVLVEAERRACSVATLQHSNLVPLELEFADTGSHMPWAQVVGGMLTALAENSTSWSS